MAGQPQSAHWYLVPHTRIDDFDALMEKIDGLEYMEAPDEFDAFENTFGEFRIDGGPYDHKVIMNDVELEYA